MRLLVVLSLATICLGRPDVSSFAGYSHGPSSSSFSSSSGYHAPTQVIKHVYVHIPPADPDEEYHAPYHPPPPAQKHVKLIFIKAPSLSAGREQYNAPQLPAIEEKTIIYVLVKKPELNLEVDSPHGPAPHTPSKPEVYFIKYNAKSQRPTFGSSSSSSFNAPSNGYIPPPLTPPQLPQLPSLPQTQYIPPPRPPPPPTNEYVPPRLPPPPPPPPKQYIPPIPPSREYLPPRTPSTVYGPPVK